MQIEPGDYTLILHSDTMINVTVRGVMRKDYGDLLILEGNLPPSISGEVLDNAISLGKVKAIVDRSGGVRFSIGARLEGLMDGSTETVLAAASFEADDEGLEPEEEAPQEEQRPADERTEASMPTDGNDDVTAASGLDLDGQSLPAEVTGPKPRRSR